MTRDDQIRATVAAGMQDCETIRSAISDAIKAASRGGYQVSIVFDIAHHIANSSIGVSHAHREFHAMRLLNTLEIFARAALTAKAEDDTPQPDDEENEQ